MVPAYRQYANTPLVSGDMTVVLLIIRPPELAHIISSREAAVRLKLSRSTVPRKVTHELSLRFLVTTYPPSDASYELPGIARAAVSCERILQEDTSYGLPQDVVLAAKSLMADVLWMSGERDASIRILEVVGVSSTIVNDAVRLVTARNLLQIGLRSSIARSKKAEDILQLYLEPAIALLVSCKDLKRGELFRKFATFCDTQLTELGANHDVLRIKHLREEKEREIKDMDDLLSQSVSSEGRRKLLNQKAKLTILHEQDNAEYKSFEAARSVYLTRCIASFLQALAIDHRSDLSVFRCVTVWLANARLDAVNDVFVQHYHTVQSHKFLVLLDQLLSRLSDKEDRFQHVLMVVLTRSATDHPFHTLYPMYALQFSQRKGDLEAKGRQRSVTNLIHNLCASRELETLVVNIRHLCGQYVKLASAHIDKKDYPSNEIPLRHLDNHKCFSTEFADYRLPPLSRKIPPRASCNYHDVPRIQTYGKTFQVAGGISAPKILLCCLDNGERIKELVRVLL